MKNKLYIISLLFALSSCGNSSKDITTADIKSPCQSYELYEVIVSDAEKLVGNKESKDELNEKQHTELQLLTSKLIEIEEYKHKTFGREDSESLEMKACEPYNRLYLKKDWINHFLSY